LQRGQSLCHNPLLPAETWVLQPDLETAMATVELQDLRPAAPRAGLERAWRQQPAARLACAEILGF
ncbi:hypothetical protein, partial [Phytohabitans aurantiacus]|uniref:hypothetical protein n=1 Tax=Phytohabitans aurantiacus TaxID=3016789 RepID=UPI0024919CDF